MLNGFNEVNWADFFSGPLLDKEINMVTHLKEALSSMVLLPEEEDRLIWIYDNKGVFSMRKLTELLISEGVVKRLWMISVSAACWSMWLARNELVFVRKWATMSSLIFLSKIRALMWIRSVHEKLKVDERIWWVCPYRSWSDIKKSGLNGRFWCPPSLGWVKFNVCGVEIEDEVRCGEVLRDSDEVVGALFSGPFEAKRLPYCGGAGN
ncbi:hypothetical protein J1N35_026005 [Gossypium stocksii]|uniref:Reverse transcriptase zinc-binding domain-containing protein n=1 Tax=Gossypium stocksii TaxID=47602 RepID=A0A9D3V7A9_9ROSI|nr:hypothetical protein J1N35_026005 [Gossypium stocksii]